MTETIARFCAAWRLALVSRAMRETDMPFCASMTARKARSVARSGNVVGAVLLAITAGAYEGVA